MGEIGQLYQSTPIISVLGNTGDQVRQLSCYRSEADVKTSLRIQLQRFDGRGHFKALFDPRFSESYLDMPERAIANYKQQTSLSGSPLQMFSVDAGMQTGLHDVLGRSLYSIDSRGSEHICEYDEIGRLVARYEESKQQEKHLIERFEYGNQHNKGINGINRLIQHTDGAGLEVIGAYNFQGQLLSQRRYFADSKSEHALEEKFYETHWRYNALGQLLSQTDAAGNQRGVVYDVAGQVKCTLLQLYQQEKNVLSNDFNYRANGQLIHESLANGVGIEYHYDEPTQRLRRLEAIRRRDNKPLYDLNYQYDPVGNVISINDRSKASNFYANQQTEVVSRYVYDSFYQLIEASGIESQQAGKETAQLPDVLPLGNTDATRCVNYRRRYHYDASGNLDQTQHTGAQCYTKKLSIDTTSNRGIEESKGLTLKQSFDANGNILYLNSGQSALAWDTQNRLKKVTQLEREKTSDEECYVYDGNHQRLEKSTVRLSKNQIHSERVRYLPGLEIRERWQTDVNGNDKKLNEVLQVIQGQAGGHSVRVLHWEHGQPESIDNDSLRMTLTEAFDTHQLELNEKAEVVSYEIFYPYGGTAIWATKNQSEVNYKFVRYSGKEKDSTGLYYYGYRYYAPWLNRWLNPDPSGISDGLNLFKMAHNNPITWADPNGESPVQFRTEYVRSFSYPRSLSEIKRENLSNELYKVKNDTNVNRFIRKAPTHSVSLQELGSLGPLAATPHPINVLDYQLPAKPLRGINQFYYKKSNRFLSEQEPINASIEHETILIHGTFSPSAAEFGWSSFKNEIIRENFPGNIVSLQWSGKNTREAREEAGKLLANRLAENTLKNIKTTVIGHSHGGNVAFEAFKFNSTFQIEQLITLATPITSRHLPLGTQLDQQVNFYMHILGESDPVASRAATLNTRFKLKKLSFPNLQKVSKETSLADVQLIIKNGGHSDVYNPFVLSLLKRLPEELRKS